MRDPLSPLMLAAAGVGHCRPDTQDFQADGLPDRSWLT